MIGLVLSILGILAVWALTKSFPEIEAKLKSFAHVGYLLLAGWFAFSLFNSIFFYAEPGFKYHVRTITGQEKMVSDTGYNSYLFGRVNAWKNAKSVQAVHGGSGDVRAEDEGQATMSASLSAQSLVFLDQVDAQVTATARFELPSDQDSFLKMARSYRTPENLLRTELIPAFQETLGATAALMSAEDYFQGGKTEFNNEFQRQMENGIYIVRRVEETVTVDEPAQGSANASLGTDQKQYGDQSKTIFIVKKILDDTGQPQRKEQSFRKFGVSVTSARVTDVDPNEEFKKRMRLRQQAAADRSIASEQRNQEEEQRLLAIAKGEREVAQRQAQAKVKQIEQTTNAETEKQLTITAAQKLKEQAQIDRERATILLEKAEIDAQAVKVAADAEAYAKAAVLEADNALAQKLDAEINIQKVWADAYAKRNVPMYVFGSGTCNTAAPTGSDSEAQLLKQLLTMEYAKRLDYDRTLNSNTQ